MIINSVKKRFLFFYIFLFALGCCLTPKNILANVDSKVIQPETAGPQPINNSTNNLSNSTNNLSNSTNNHRISELCSALDNSIARLKWKINACNDLDWQEAGQSVQGRPLIYAEFGNPKSQNVTLIFSSVHGDELTPLYIGIELAHWLKQHQELLSNTRVVIAPLVNPDGFFRFPRTRMNARGVDINRNFATRDWPERALKAWKVKFRSDPRRFPGSSARSEPETLFQENLIKKFKPTKLLSIHAPLNFLDYDGPTTLSLAKFPSDYVRECLKLRARLRAISSGFFPGSLGNFAGQELGIPTLTMELPTANPAQAATYWKKFSSGIKTMIEFAVPDYASRLISSHLNK